MKDKELNIRVNKDRLIRMALKKYDTKKEAAEALGITVRHLSNLEPTLNKDEKE